MSEKIVVARHGAFHFFAEEQPLSEEGKGQAQILAPAILRFIAEQPHNISIHNSIIVASYARRADEYANALHNILGIAYTSLPALGRTSGVAEDCDVIVEQLKLFTDKYAAVILVAHSPTTHFLPPFFGAKREKLLNVTSKDFEFPSLDMGEAYGIHTITGDVIRLPK